MEVTTMSDELNLTQVILDWSQIFMRRSMRDFTHYTRSTGQSLGQMNVLMHLYYKGPSEVMNFSELMEVSPAGASQMVDRMVQQGLVLRAESPDDRRVRIVNITAQGRKLVEDSISARQVWMEELMKTLTGEQKNQIAMALKTLTEKAIQLEDGEKK
jgi:DNA-binding MarR family transcriptional regulator